jgi:hypothetical protein
VQCRWPTSCCLLLSVCVCLPAARRPRRPRAPAPRQLPAPAATSGQQRSQPATPATGASSYWRYVALGAAQNRLAHGIEAAATAEVPLAQQAGWHTAAVACQQAGAPAAHRLRLRYAQRIQLPTGLPRLPRQCQVPDGDASAVSGLPPHQLQRLRARAGGERGISAIPQPPAPSPRAHFCTAARDIRGDRWGAGAAATTQEELPGTLHTGFRSALDGLDDAGIFQYDITQPMGPGTPCAVTKVTRTCVGEPGITYKYLGLRMFGHPWTDEEAQTDSHDRVVQASYVSLRRQNEALVERSRSLLTAEVVPPPPLFLFTAVDVPCVQLGWGTGSPIPRCWGWGVETANSLGSVGGGQGKQGSTEFSLTLINRMEVRSVFRPAPKIDIRARAVGCPGKPCRL